MKQTMLITILLAGILNVNAQTPAPATEQVTSGPSLSNNDNTNTTARLNVNAMDIFNATTVAVSDRIIRFNNIPEDYTVKAYVTNVEGELVKNKRLSASDNTIDLTRMSAGLYFVTIMNKNKRKCFKVNL